MTLVTLTRAHKAEDVTLGMLQVQGTYHKPIYTLENPYINNIRNISCIPTGVYKVVPYSGVKYKGVYLVENVKNRSAILFHWGNFESDTQGCVLVGMGAGRLMGKPAITSSRKAMKYLKTVLDYQPFTLEIL